MNEKFQELEKKYKNFKQIENQLILLNNSKNKNFYLTLLKKHKTLKKTLQHYLFYKKILKELNEIKNIIEKESNDPEFKKLAINEQILLKKNKDIYEKKIYESFLLTNTLINEKIFFELRAASGGNEAAIFVEDLLKMYTNYFNNKKWKYEIITSTKGNISGYKEIILTVKGKNIISLLKNESGIHRVQRVPITDGHGKIQTSTCTIAVLPNNDNTENIEINTNDIRIDTFRASGAGGQHVNMTDSAVRITHIPTNIVVECQNERSQHKNKNNALSLLKSRLLIKKKRENKHILDHKRKNMVGSGDRSDKIRTYNYIKNRITDHRKNIVIYKFKEVINGNLSLIIDKLIKKNEQI